MRKYLLALSLVIFVSGCSSLSLSTDYDKKIDFSNFKTYRWHKKIHPPTVDGKPTTSTNDIMDSRIRATINQHLQAQHYTLSDSKKIDFLVNYSVVIENKTDIRTYNNYSGYSPGFQYGYGSYGQNMALGFGTSDTKVTHYQQGTLIVDIINPETNQLMWRGSADGRLPKNTNQEENDKLIKKYINKVLSGFPPKQQ